MPIKFLIYVDGHAHQVCPNLASAQAAALDFVYQGKVVTIEARGAPAVSRSWHFDAEVGAWVEQQQG